MKSVLNESINWRNAQHELPQQQRAAIYLSYSCGMPSNEVGDLMGCRPATVRRYVHLARRKLEAVLNDDE